MKATLSTTAILVFSQFASAAESAPLHYPGADGPGKGKHVVLIAGDEEYRSEDGLPMLGKILSQHHGFDCTVLFSVSPDGVIDPECRRQPQQPGGARLRGCHRDVDPLPQVAGRDDEAL